MAKDYVLDKNPVAYWKLDEAGKGMINLKLDEKKEVYYG